MTHEMFHYSSLEDIRKKTEELGVSFPMSEDIAPLMSEIEIAGRVLPNRIALSPMEGTDGTEDGAPDTLTYRRYKRFAEGGAALIWFEAVSTVPEGRASAHQLMLTKDNLDSFKRIVEDIRESGMKKNGFAPMIIMQATNSGRYSKPTGVPAPLIAYNNPVLEDTPLPAERIVSDEKLWEYSQRFGDMARLCHEAGFDGMDVKCCHRYLACELLSAYTRPGRYGGSYENRTRFLKDAYEAASAEISDDFFLTSRMNVYDGFEYPWGFGAGENLSEAIRLVGELKDKYNLPILNVTIGNPYKNPHVNRPYDHGNYVPPEHPLEGVARLMRCVSKIQKAYPELPVIGSGFSYPRVFAPNVAAGMIREGGCSLAGFGRMAFAYPDFPNDLKEKGILDRNKICLSCGGCAVLLRSGTPAGCVVRDREVYHL